MIASNRLKFMLKFYASGYRLLMNAPEKIRLTEFSHGGGCGCKIAPAVLSEILAAAPKGSVFAELLVGTETADDAAVYRLNETQALVATTDFFTPVVDDPYDFGRIAATNAISDVYAMGARPIMALALVGMPLEKLPVSVIRKVLEGGESVRGRRHSDRRRTLDRYAGADLRPGGARACASRAVKRNSSGKPAMS